MSEIPTVQHGPFDLPGLNLPLKWKPLRRPCGAPDFEGQATADFSLYPNALDYYDVSGEYQRCALPLITLRELAMLHLMNSITDKPGWDIKVFDDAIAEKWKSEAMATPGADVTQSMADWVIDELRHKVPLFKATGAVTVYNGDVVKSDIAIPLDLKTALKNEVQKLEDIPSVYKDYHPNSDDKVLDIVHPSLFPLVYGRSRVLRDHVITIDESVEAIGTGIAIEIPPGEVAPVVDPQRFYRPVPETTPYSRQFQWLPCEVKISDNEARITSYINNLHPKQHRVLYSVVEKIIWKALPLWNMTLSALEADHQPVPRVDLGGYELLFDPAAEDVPSPPRHDNEDEDGYYDRSWQWKQEHAVVILPEVKQFQPFDNGLPVSEDSDKPVRPEFHTDLVGWYRDRGLQVIVKLANIELKPESPEYGGGSWHVEGQLNEHICATALYYYDNENITDSHLSFRQQSDPEPAEEMPYPQSEHEFLTAIFGCDPNGPAIQEVGSVLCKEDRLLTFPNILQHRVQPFKLADPSKPGHRKILALFLVDPGIRIISTANVPPQQRHWWSQTVDKIFSDKSTGLGKLSNEVREKVYEQVDDFPISMEEAKEIRLRLMEERKTFSAQQAGEFERREFSLCEH